MTVYVVLETRRGERDIESIWPTAKAAMSQVSIIIATKPRPELWGMHGIDLAWTDGVDELRIAKHEIRVPGWMHHGEVEDDRGTHENKK